VIAPQRFRPFLARRPAVCMSSGRRRLAPQPCAVGSLTEHVGASCTPSILHGCQGGWSQDRTRGASVTYGHGMYSVTIRVSAPDTIGSPPTVNRSASQSGSSHGAEVSANASTSQRASIPLRRSRLCNNTSGTVRTAQASNPATWVNVVGDCDRVSLAYRPVQVRAQSLQASRKGNVTVTERSANGTMEGVDTGQTLHQTEGR